LERQVGENLNFNLQETQSPQNATPQASSSELFPQDPPPRREGAAEIEEITRPNHQPPSRKTPTQNPNLTALKALLNTTNDDEQQEDTTALLEFALKEQLDISAVLLAGLRALKAQQERSSSSIEPYYNTRKDGVVDRRPEEELWAKPEAAAFQSSQLPLTMMPDPLANGIFLRQQAPLEVYFYNCGKLGIPFDEMTKPTVQSPWILAALHNNNGTGIGPLSSSSELPLLPQQGMLLDNVPPDLYPTPSQRSIAHHPFWDTIPFPWIRERVISFAAVDPPVFEWQELKADILNGGMVVWRSRGSEEGVPWDRRSWEFRPWFRRKWGWLVEEQGKIEGQSRWWRALQGAEI
jgi:hypothetical protein